MDIGDEKRLFQRSQLVLPQQALGLAKHAISCTYSLNHTKRGSAFITSKSINYTH